MFRCSSRFYLKLACVLLERVRGDKNMSLLSDAQVIKEPGGVTDSSSRNATPLPCLGKVMSETNTTVTRNNAPHEIRASVEVTGSNGLFAQMRLCCQLYALVVLLLILALTLSAQVYPAVIGMAVLVTCYVSCLMIEFVICGDRDELHR
jgi:hypothetical protein